MAKFVSFFKSHPKNYTKFHKSQMTYLDIGLSKYSDNALFKKGQKFHKGHQSLLRQLVDSQFQIL